jgi:hypothetical protein
MTIKLKIRFRMRVAAAALAVALGWISTPLSLASWEPDVCEMECCIAEGHCCCANRHAYVKGREPKPGDVSISLDTTLTKPCPAGCPASGVSTQNKLPRATHAHAPVTTLADITVQRYRDRFLLDHQFIAQSSSPRAPPVRTGL